MRFTVLALCLSAVMLTGCGEKTKTVPEPASRPVKLMAVEVGESQSYRTFPAQVQAGDKAVLAFRVSGMLESVAVLDGQEVKKGQRLAQLKTDEFKLLVEQAKANYRLANVQYQRNRELLKTNVVSELDFDQSKAARNQAKAELDKQEANLRYATLLAPYNGTVSISMVNNFEYVSAKQPVMHIQSEGLLSITFQLPQQLLSRLRAGDDRMARVIFDTLPDEEFEARLKEIDTEADTKTSSFQITLTMEKPVGQNLLPGMAAQVRIALPHTGAGALPERAVMHEAGKTYVWQVAENGAVSKVEVELNDSFRVIRGLEDGAMIATSGVAELKEGQVVREWVKERGL
ncbi:efflux RND transporter periplasmic adaptor subunit [Photobacterium sp. 1_MG-2023]|uniref:efflux RND transporter periplasmic adaptor subunit n=1 Tax=Photobacterium sp. 1_MG-2023 TaxID=3062646 RepID=UPI0026E2F143|nr:efflux RND transporter periplasmic adaptor subunit [Photobacterium sp. 1_MG-2023]MDO6706630.1 efflux RND transporter periplasmic adaptor subunit [Photobacterium sp. 1_MG-2023]